MQFQSLSMDGWLIWNYVHETFLLYIFTFSSPPFSLAHTLFSYIIVRNCCCCCYCAFSSSDRRFRVWLTSERGEQQIKIYWTNTSIDSYELTALGRKKKSEKCKKESNMGACKSYKFIFFTFSSFSLSN